MYRQSKIAYSLFPIPLALLISGASSARCEQLFESLHSQLTGDDTSNGCTEDPLKLGTSAFVISAKESLGITNASIIFLGCTKSSFKTGSGPKTTTGGTYKIFYPVGIGDTGGQDRYIAPIIHELGHVYQIEHVGSLGKLKDKYCIERIELGADFLAGIAFKNSISRGELNKFQASLDLLGDYVEPGGDNHGQPEDRTSAFRRGYFYPNDSAEYTIDLAYDSFQLIDFWGTVSGSSRFLTRCKL